MSLSVNQEIGFLILGSVIWFALVVPSYALQIDMRNALETQGRKQALSKYCGNYFEVSCVIAGGLSGLFVGFWVSAISYWFVLLASFITMTLIGMVSSMILKVKTGEVTMEKPGRVALFLIAGTTIFWASALLLSWLLNPNKLPKIDSFEGLIVVISVLGSLVSIVSFFWEKMPIKGSKTSG